MERRQALQLSAAMFGSVIIGSELFLSGCGRKEKLSGLFAEEDIAFLDEVGETILPETEQSPGAKSTQIGTFMLTIVTDCYSDEESQAFVAGIKEINQRSKERFNENFLSTSAENKLKMLSEIDRESRNHNEDNPHYFTMMKQLTIWGYFTSEPGATIALRYNPIPGSYRGCVPYQRGDKAWAS